MNASIAIVFSCGNGACNNALVFSGAGAIRKMPEDVSLDSVGIISGPLTEEVFATAVAVIKLDTLTPAYLNFKSVRPAVCVATRCVSCLSRIHLFTFICSWFGTPVCATGPHPVHFLVVVIAVFWWQVERNQTISVDSAGELVWWCAPEDPDGFTGRRLVRGPEGSHETVVRWFLRDNAGRCVSAHSDGLMGRWLRRHVG